MANNDNVLPKDAGEDTSMTSSPGKDVAEGKGKAKIDSATHGVMEEDDSSSDEEPQDAPEPEEEDEDNMEEIDTTNIISGGRTRGRNIDFAKAAEQSNDLEEDEDDDEDFEEDEDAMKD